MAAARSTPSKMTADGSPPSSPRTSSAPDRSAHVAELLGGGGAERVAGGHQHRPADRSSAGSATLPMVVVLPTPLTPTNSHTFGLPASAGLEVQRAIGAVEAVGHVGLQCVEQRVRAR